MLRPLFGRALLYVQRRSASTIIYWPFSEPGLLKYYKINSSARVRKGDVIARFDFAERLTQTPIALLLPSTFTVNSPCQGQLVEINTSQGSAYKDKSFEIRTQC
jgi:hypothetical protein